MALDFTGATVVVGTQYVLAGTCRRIDGDSVLLVLNDAQDIAIRVKAADIKRVVDTGGGGGGSSAWGSITGTLSSQTDLQAALDAKAPTANPTFTGTALFNFAGSLVAPTLPEHFIRALELTASQTAQDGAFLSYLFGPYLTALQGAFVAIGTVVKAATITVPYGESEFTATVTDAACSPASKIVVGWGNPTDDDENSPLMDDVAFLAAPGSGSFSVTIASKDGGPIGGPFKLHYTLG